MLVPKPQKEIDANKDYRYGFQGQEKDDEIKGEGKSLNYTFRMHDPRVGRFFAVDPLAPKYPHNSPYAFSENRVIDGIELEGLEVKIIISDKPVGEIELRIINSEYLKDKMPSKISVPLYELTIHDEATNEISYYNVTRDALIIDSNSKPDENGNFLVKNLAFEPKEGSSNKYEGLIIDSFGNTELPALLLLQNGKNKLPAEPIKSDFRKKDDEATGITIHVGGAFTTSTTPSGRVRITGSEGCFTCEGGNNGISNLIEDIKNRQKELKENNKQDNIEIEVVKRENITREIEVKSNN